MYKTANTKRKVLKSGHVTGAEQYIQIKVEDETGKKEEKLLFTPHQIEIARKRAAKNPEDLMKDNFIRNLLD
jgi:hypothetical protein